MSLPVEGDAGAFRSDAVQVPGRKSARRSGREYPDMRILLAGAAAAAIAFSATPAFAQYGGSPQDQVEGAPAEPEMTAPPEDEDATMADRDGVADPDAPAYLETEVDMDPDADAGEMAGKPEAAGGGEDYAYADIDTDMDADADIDPEDAGPGDLDQDIDAPEEAAPAEEGATWQGEDGRTYCRRSDGTTGLIVGGGAGALVGRGIDGGRHRGTGTILGAIAGAIVGSAIEQSANQQRCR
jgi:hypothetical protein